MNVDRLTKVIEEIYGLSLVSAYTYTPDFETQKTKPALLIIVETLPFEMLRAHRCFAGFFKKTVGSVKLFTRDEFMTSLDVFPIEFLDILEDRTLLAGQDVLASVSVDPVHLRHECEFYLRSSILKLREGYGLGHTGTDVLISTSFPMFLSIFRQVLFLLKTPIPTTADEVLSVMSGLLSVDLTALEGILQKTLSTKTESTFEAYLTALDSLSRQMDALGNA